MTPNPPPSELMTMITDYVLGAECLVLAVLLFRSASRREQRWWAFGLVGSGMAAILGGTVHGFPSLPTLWSVPMWKITVYSIGLSSFALACAAVSARLTGRARRILIYLLSLELGVYCVWMLQHSEFKFVVWHYVPCMILVLVIDWRTLPTVAGILLSFLAAGVQQSGFDLAPGFNHNDLYHVIQMVAMYFLYRGGRRLIL